MTTALIELADVRLTLGQGEVRTEILKGISLRLDPGESLAILGPSGSGKSSLMAVVAGLERATSGSVRLLGEDASALGEDALARMRGRDIGIVVQRRDNNLVSGVNGIGERPGEVECQRRHAGAKDDRLRPRRVQQVCDCRPCARDHAVCAAAGLECPADIGIGAAVILGNGDDDTLWDLGPAGIIKKGGGMTVQGQ